MQDDDAVKRIEAAFAIVEQRVQALVTENRGLKERVRELEGEIAQARRSSQDLEHLHSRRMHIREKVERVLQSLEALKESK
jgi:cell division septum initiation protein DivIVA